jgi:putative Mg2+ transporter-C (MgtC) family protein
MSMVIPLLLAALFGGLIGTERQLSGKAAGLRTNMLICLGAALFTIISEKLGINESSTRIAAQIVTGVGFLGAGAVIQDRGGVHGLTTAATIWLVAAIGMACGFGLYMLAAATTITALVVLLVLAPVARFLTEYGKKHNIRFHLSEGQDERKNHNTTNTFLD